MCQSKQINDSQELSTMVHNIHYPGEGAKKLLFGQITGIYIKIDGLCLCDVSPLNAAFILLSLLGAFLSRFL